MHNLINHAQSLQDTVAGAHILAADYLATLSTDKLSHLTARLEAAVLEARNLLENTRTNTELLKPGAPRLPEIQVAGSVEMLKGRWLHITLNTLLPHCRFRQPRYLKDTITRLLAEYKARHGALPFYQRAFVVIDERCGLDGRDVYDPDNVGWKGVPNALKGYIFPDDSQSVMSLVLTATRDKADATHIYVVGAPDMSDFFALTGMGQNGRTDA